MIYHFNLSWLIPVVVTRLTFGLTQLVTVKSGCKRLNVQAMHVAKLIGEQASDDIELHWIIGLNLSC